MIRFMQKLENRNPHRASRAGRPLRLRWVLLFVALALPAAWLSIKSVQDYQALQGFTAQAAVLDEKLSGLRGENTNLQIQIHRLSANSIDLDFLDERVRLVLGLAAKGETIIFDSGL